MLLFLFISSFLCHVHISYLSPTPPSSPSPPESNPVVISYQTSCSSRCVSYTDVDSSLMLHLTYDSEANSFTDTSQNEWDVELESIEKADGLFGQKAVFDGYDSVIEILDFTCPGPNSTVSLWFSLEGKGENVTGQDSNSNLISWYGYGGFLLRVTDDGWLCPFLRDEETGSIDYSQMRTVCKVSMNRTLYHLVYQIQEIDSSHSRNRFYINKEMVREFDVDYHVGSPRDTEATLRIGKWGSYRSIYGSIEEVMVFSRVLSEDEVMSLYDSRLMNKTDVSLNLNESEDHMFFSCVFDVNGESNCTDRVGLGDGIPPSISNFSVSMNDDTALITFNTSEICESEITYYYDDSNTFVQKEERFKSAHEVKLTRLRRGMKYSFSIKVWDFSITEGETVEGSFDVSGDDSEIYITPKPQILERDVESRVFITDEWSIITETQKWNSNYLNSKIEKFVEMDIIEGIDTYKMKKMIVIERSDHELMEKIANNNGLRVKIYNHSESYSLHVTSNLIYLTSISDKGLFYGIQTIIQLFRHDGSVPICSINDWSDKKIRGLFDHVDDIKFRDSNKLDYYKDYVDWLAEIKMNFIVLTSSFFKYDPSNYEKEIREFASYLGERYIEIAPCGLSLRNQFPKVTVNEGRYFENVKLTFRSNNVAQTENGKEVTVTNPSFETSTDEDLDGWKCSSGSSDETWNAKFSIDNSDSSLGSKSVKVDGGYIYQDIYGIKEDEIYFLFSKTKGEYTCFLGIYFYNNQSQRLDDAYVNKGTYTDEWTDCGCSLRAPKGAYKMRILLYGKNGPIWHDDVQVISVSGGLFNVHRAPTTDFVITNKDGSVVYTEGVDYSVVNGTSTKYFSRELESFQINRITEGSIPNLGSVYASFDAMVNWGISPSSKYNTPPCVSDERLYTDYYFPTLDHISQILNSTYVHLNNDEIRGFQTDSRNLRRGLNNSELLAWHLNRVMDYGLNLNQNMKFFMWEDMINIYHNGYDSYQNRFKGKLGGMQYIVEDRMFNHQENFIPNIWWYEDKYLFQMKKSTEYFKKYNFSYVFSSSTSGHGNSISWTELMANDDNCLGGIITCWDTTNDYNNVYLTHFDHLWNTRSTVDLFESFESYDSISNFLEKYNVLNSSLTYEQKEKILDCGNKNQHGSTINSFSVCAMKITSQDGVQSNFIEYPTKKVGKEFVFSTMVMAVSDSSMGNITIEFYNEDEEFISSFENIRENITTKYTLFDIVGIVPSQTKYYKISFLSIGDSILYLDTIRVKSEHLEEPEILQSFGVQSNGALAVVWILLSMLVVFFLVFVIIVGLFLIIFAVFFHRKEQIPSSSEDIEM